MTFAATAQSTTRLGKKQTSLSHISDRVEAPMRFEEEDKKPRKLLDVFTRISELDETANLLATSRCILLEF